MVECRWVSSSPNWEEGKSHVGHGKEYLSFSTGVGFRRQLSQACCWWSGVLQVMIIITLLYWCVGMMVCLWMGDSFFFFFFWPVGKRKANLFRKKEPWEYGGNYERYYKVRPCKWTGLLQREGAFSRVLLRHPRVKESSIAATLQVLEALCSPLLLVLISFHGVPCPQTSLGNIIHLEWSQSKYSLQVKLPQSKELPYEWADGLHFPIWHQINFMVAYIYNIVVLIRK